MTRHLFLAALVVMGVILDPWIGGSVLLILLALAVGAPPPSPPDLPALHVVGAENAACDEEEDDGILVFIYDGDPPVIVVGVRQPSDTWHPRAPIRYPVLATNRG